MNRPLFPALAIALCFAASALYAEDKEHPAEIQVEITLSEGDKVVERAMLHTDLQDNGSSFQGDITMKLPQGGRWLVSINASFGTEKSSDDDRELYVGVSDLATLGENMREGNRAVYPIQIVGVERRWRGPGFYRIAEHGNLVLAAKVVDTPALQKKAGAVPTPVVPAGEKP